MKTYQDDPVVQKNRWWILLSVAMFTFMSTLDSSIVNIALPTISKDLAVPMNKAEWVVSIYLMIVCACLLLFGKVGDSFGKIKVYRIGTLIFTLGSLLCGFNHSLAMLLFGRVIQGIGASMTLLSITQLLYVFMNQLSPIWYYVLATAIMGMGNALFQSPNNTIVMSSVEKENLGVAGSMNSFARNLGMVIGIALSTTILYSGMSASYGQRVTTYIDGRPDIFIFGMRVTFMASLVICVIALVISLVRFSKKAVN